MDVHPTKNVSKKVLTHTHIYIRIYIPPEFIPSNGHAQRHVQLRSQQLGVPVEVQGLQSEGKVMALAAKTC